MSLTANNLSIIYEYCFLKEKLKLKLIHSYFHNWNITKLDYIYNRLLDGNSLKLFPNLTKLSDYRLTFKNNDIKHLTNLTYLDIEDNPCLTYDSIKNMTKLQYLNIADTYITDKGLQKLTNLTCLTCSYNFLTDKSLSKLVKLKELNIFDTCSIYFDYSNDIKYCFKFLTNLNHLNITNCNIVDDDLKYLTNLTFLGLGETQYITNNLMSHLTKLVKLCIYQRVNITLDGIKKLPNLKHIYISSNYRPKIRTGDLKNLGFKQYKFDLNSYEKK